MAKLVVTPVFTLVNKKAKASENWHWKFPYSSEAKRNSKLNVGEIGVKSNSKTVALVEFIVIPDWANVLSKLESPGQLAFPSFSSVAFGPTALVTLPVLRITPDFMGNLGFVFWKKPIPFTEPKLLPVRVVTFVADTQGELIKTELTNWVVEYELVSTLMACEKQFVKIVRASMSITFFMLLFCH